MRDLDRFDRMLLSVPHVVKVPRLAVPAPTAEREPVITSKRGPKFVDHMACPMCGVERVGIEYHGVLMSGAKVHTVAAHSAGKRSVVPRQPRCLGAGMRVVFEDGAWKGLA